MKSLKICIVRLSALGDVALTVPVLENFGKQYPQHRICLITRTQFAPLFSHITNLEIFAPDLYGKHKGLKGLYKLYSEIKTKYKPDYFIDLHDVLRSKILRKYFRLSGTKTLTYNKGRIEKIQNISGKKNKSTQSLKHTTERYAETFRKAGFEIKLNYTARKFETTTGFGSDFSKKRIGIAPYAAHKGKAFPTILLEQILDGLSDEKYEIFIFGGGLSEKTKAENLENTRKNVKSVIGKYQLSEELALMQTMHVMLVPDSGNMHLAALAGVHIVSIWGATHPALGFTAFLPAEKQTLIQNNHLTCRPCSVFGNKDCYKGTWECLTSLSADEIISEIQKHLT